MGRDERRTEVDLVIVPRMREKPCMNLRQLDNKHFGRQGEPEDVVVGNSADSYLIDARGRKYIDFMMGSGHSDESSTKEVVTETNRRIYRFPA